MASLYDLKTRINSVKSTQNYRCYENGGSGKIAACARRRRNQSPILDPHAAGDWQSRQKF